MTVLGEYNYASADYFSADDEDPSSFGVFLTVSPIPSKYPLSPDQQYKLHMGHLLKILKHFNFYGCVEFTPLRGLFHIHCHLTIDHSDRKKWIKSIKPLKLIGNTDIKLVKDSAEDRERIHKYIHKDIELTKSLLDKSHKTLIDTTYATSYDKSYDLSVDVTTPLDLGIKSLSIKTKYGSTEPPS